MTESTGNLISKCSRVVGDVMGQYHPHGDTAIYDAMVRLVQPWTMRYPLVAGQGNFGSPGDDGAAAPRYTECKMAPLAMEMVRDIEEGTVDFVPNYDGKTSEPVVLPSRIPNLLVNGATGIAVGMATNMAPHNLTSRLNMLALVDGVPRTLTIDQFISNWVAHQIDVIQRRTRFRLAEAEARPTSGRGLVKALDMLDEVIALIRRSPTVDDARTGLMELLDIDEIQADAILGLQLRRLAALERQKIIDELAELENKIADLKDILANVSRQRQIVSTELAEIVDRYGDDRRTQIVPYDGDMSMEDLITEEDVVVTITRGGYAKRTQRQQYRAQKRGGKGVRGAALRADDVVQHFIATTNHHWLLFFTTAGRVYRTKAYNLPEASRDAKGGHVAGLLSFQPDESIAQVLAIRDYEQAPYLVLATRNGLVKKTRLGDYNSPRQAGVIAINFREDDDELIGAELVTAEDHILLVSRKGQAIRFPADDSQLRPMGRATSGVTGMKFRDGDSMLSMSVIRAAQVEAEDAVDDAAEKSDDSVEAVSEYFGVNPQYVFTITDGGFAKRSRITEYRTQSRGGLGIKVMTLTNEDRGGLVGAFIVEGDEILSITQAGQVVRSPINADFRATGRATQGVKFVSPKSGDTVAVVARSVEAREDDEEPVAEAVEEAPAEGSAPAADAVEVSEESSETGDGATIDDDPNPTGE